MSDRPFAGKAKNQFSLFGSKNFMPLFATQFLGAFNDNFFKSSMVMLITYRLADRAGYDARILVNVAAGIFILPFFLFSALAGQLADKYERSRLVQRVKIAEIFIMAGAVAGFYLQSIPLLMLVLFLMGTQSAFFGPLKYCILPQHLEESELIAGNGLIQMGTVLSILLGTIFGGISVLRGGGLRLVSVTVVGIAVVGWWASRHIPEAPPVNPGLKPSFHVVGDTLKIVRDVLPRRDVFLSLLGISWFWLVGATFLAQFPTYARLILGANEQVATLFLAVFSVGIGAGSLACNGLLKGEVSGRYVPWAALGMSAGSVLLYFFSLRDPVAADGAGIGMAEFLAQPSNWAILLSLFAISAFGGIYIVPLYAIIQSRTEESRMAGVVACINISNSLFMVVSAVGASLLLAAGLTIPQIFLFMAVLTVIAAVFIRHAVRVRLRSRGEI